MFIIMDIIWFICVIFVCIIIICVIIFCWLGILSILGFLICWLNFFGCICCWGLNFGWVCCDGCWWMKFLLIGDWFIMVFCFLLDVFCIFMFLLWIEIVGMLGFLGVMVFKWGLIGILGVGCLFWLLCVILGNFCFFGWEVSGVRVEFRRWEFFCGVVVDVVVFVVLRGVVVGWVVDLVDIIDFDLVKS